MCRVGRHSPIPQLFCCVVLFLSGVLTDERKFNAGGVFDAALARLPDLMRSGALSILRRFPPFMGVWVSGVRRGLRIGSDVLSIGLFTACAAYSGTVQAPFTV